MNDMVQQLVVAARGTDRFVRSSPWRAVGTLALAGFAAGILASKDTQRRQRRTADVRNCNADTEVAGG